MALPEPPVALPSPAGYWGPPMMSGMILNMRPGPGEGRDRGPGADLDPGQRLVAAGSSGSGARSGD